MTSGDQIQRYKVSPMAPFMSTSSAKARLLAWADERDAAKLKARSSFVVIAAVGGTALFGGLLVARMLLPRQRSGGSQPLANAVGKQLIRWALLVRAGSWLLPHVISAVRGAAGTRPLFVENLARGHASSSSKTVDRYGSNS